MKKFLFLTLVLCAIVTTATYAQPTQPAQQAQPAPDPAVMLQQMKDKIYSYETIKPFAPGN